MLQPDVLRIPRIETSLCGRGPERRRNVPRRRRTRGRAFFSVLRNITPVSNVTIHFDPWDRVVREGSTLREVAIATALVRSPDNRGMPGTIVLSGAGYTSGEDLMACISLMTSGTPRRTAAIGSMRSAGNQVRLQDVKLSTAAATAAKRVTFL